jgi:putative polymerase
MLGALSETVLIGAVCFNAILAIINGHIVGLTRSHVVFAEMAIYAGAFTIVLLRADRRMMPWFLLALFMVLLALLLSLGNGSFNAKYLRDVLVIPTFIMLGMTYERESLVKPVLLLQTVIFLVAGLEAVRTETYADLFRILDYYINTRDFAKNSFWNTDSTLFVSATRPSDRFFSFVDLHRLSSIFLEPVSLGNYCVMASILIISFWKELTTGVRIYLIATTLGLLIGCDGRLATASIFIILILAPFFAQISSRCSAAYLPVVLIASAVYVWALNIDYDGDTFKGRLSGSIHVLSELGLSGIMGLNAQSADGAADSGIAYFILTQSTIGVAVIWLSICFLPSRRAFESRAYVHAIAIFIPLNLMVSYSFFSIKVASLIWFCYGYLYARLPAVENAVIEDIDFHPALDQFELT